MTPATPSERDEARRLSNIELIGRRFLRNVPGVAGLAALGVLVIIAVIGPHALPWHFEDIDRLAYLKPPSTRHWLGTTQAGRDVLALTVRGMSKSLLIGFFVAAGSTGLAAIVGASIAYVRGWYEKGMLWIIDLLMVIPPFFLIAIMTAGYGEDAWIVLIFLLAGFGWMLSARVVRALTLSVKEREFVYAAKYMGVSPPRVILRHILPNISSLLIIDSTLNVGYAILSETGLTYLGFGVQPPDTSLGTLISEGAGSATTFPWVFLAPSIIVVVLVMSVNAVGDALRDAFDPSSGAGSVRRVRRLPGRRHHLGETEPRGTSGAKSSTPNRIRSSLRLGQTSNPAGAPLNRVAVDGEVVLRVRDLQVTLPSENGTVSAVRGLSFDLAAGETMAIVGESGSGKTASALAIMGLSPPEARVAGSVVLNNMELLGASDAVLSRVRGKDIAMVFQDPLSALTPVFTVGNQIAEAIRAHDRTVSRAAARDRAIDLLKVVGVPNPRLYAMSYPFELSGGMRQRAVIAMAIAHDPAVIIADEPTTALDVTIASQVLEALEKAKAETGAALILISHDLGIVARMADTVTVMYAGLPVERGTTKDIFFRPAMPYTVGLLGAVPRLDTDPSAPLAALDGHPPSATETLRGCAFAPRCPLAIEACSESPPILAPHTRLRREPASSLVRPSRSSGVDERSEDHTRLRREPASRFAGPSRLSAVDQHDEEQSDEHTPGHDVACHQAGVVGERQAAGERIFPVPQITKNPFSAIPRSERTTVLSVRGLKRHYPRMAGSIYRRQVGAVMAVDGIDLELKSGETLALVGESGCGKTTTLLEVLNLVPPSAGTITVFGKDVASLDRRARKAMRRDLQVVFQDPLASLDPRMPVFDIVAEPMTVFGYTSKQIDRRVHDLLELVGLRPNHANRYPQHLSSGQRQRIAIARALALEPKVVVLDEPVSALDVSIQAGVINLLDDLQGKLGLAYLWVTHDLAVARHIAHRVAVMYLGRIVEEGSVDDVFGHPAHPYTQALLSAIPVPDPTIESTRLRRAPASSLVWPNRLSVVDQHRDERSEEHTRLRREPASSLVRPSRLSGVEEQSDEHTRLRREPASSLVRPSRLSAVDQHDEERSDEHSGCAFRTRCARFSTFSPDEQSSCEVRVPHLAQMRKADHRSACHFNDQNP